MFKVVQVAADFHIHDANGVMVQRHGDPDVAAERCAKMNGGATGAPVSILDEMPTDYSMAALDGNLTRLRAALAAIGDAAHVQALLDAERSGNTRKGALRALTARLSELTA